MKFFFPDSQDFVDPSFDFEEETRAEDRVRQRDDLYPHEIFAETPYDGILVSKAIVDRTSSTSAKYNIAQRNRLLRDGIRGFFRLDERPSGNRVETMGDCGAFAYVKDESPLWTVDEVVEFYERCGFDFGISVDHVIPIYRPELDDLLAFPELGENGHRWQHRQELTIELAREFFALSAEGRTCFTPIGVAQGWSPKSYANAAGQLQDVGFRLIALGGMVSLKNEEILACLSEIAGVRRPDTELHLLGVTRFSQIPEFERLGVTSFDSTSPLKQAFKDDKHNYHTLSGVTYPAIRVPQVDANVGLKRRIGAGEVDGREARDLERACMNALAAFDQDEADISEVLSLLEEYESKHSKRASRIGEYERVLSDRPWRECDCAICEVIGIHVILFRGAERNRRRGFHNLYTAYQTLQKQRALAIP